VLRGLEALQQQVEATFEQKRFLLRSQLTDEASGLVYTCPQDRRHTRLPVSRHRPLCASCRSPGTSENVVPKPFGVFTSASFQVSCDFGLSKTG
jgi:hypothetical protein